MIDLHLHTKESDGILSPRELIERCSAIGLETVAITDHDSTEGVIQAIETGVLMGVDVISGVELGVDEPGSEIHILGYFVNIMDEELQTHLKAFRDNRIDRGQETVLKLAELGYHIEWERVLELADGSVGRPHIAAALVEKNYFDTPRQVFNELLGRNGKAYVEKLKVSAKEAILMLTRNGAVPVLAHPSYVQPIKPDGSAKPLDEVISELKNYGMAGIEVFYGDYTPEQVEHYLSVANAHGLIPLGGSDFHGEGTSVPMRIGQNGPPEESLGRLRESVQ